MNEAKEWERIPFPGEDSWGRLFKLGDERKRKFHGEFDFSCPEWVPKSAEYLCKNKESQQVTLDCML